MAMDMDERWVNRSPKAMLETFHWFRGEGFSMIIEDILRLPKKPGVIAEGFRLAPHLVKPLLAVRSHAVWLLPTPEFRQVVIDSRGGPEWGFLGRTSDPERTLRHRLASLHPTAIWRDRDNSLVKENGQVIQSTIRPGAIEFPYELFNLLVVVRRHRFSPPLAPHQQGGRPNYGNPDSVRRHNKMAHPGKEPSE